MEGDKTAQRLRALIIADAALTLSGAAFTVAIYLATDSTVWLFWIGLFVAVLAVTMAVGLVPLGRGNQFAALLWLCGSNWAAAVVVSAVATFAWPLMLQAALLPAAIAVAFVSRPRFVGIAAISVVTAAGSTCLGLFQDFSGLSDNVPHWSRSTVLVVFAPLIAALVVFIALQNSFRLQAALDEALHAQVALADRADELRRSRARVVAATDRERQRIERDLHDGAQSRLVAINLRLAHARTTLRTDPDETERTLELLRNETHETQAELRNLAHGVYPTALTKHGLVPAIQAAADHCPIPVQLDLEDVGRHPLEIESACYFCVLEALQNAVKHSTTDRIEIALTRDGKQLQFRVADRGIGFRPGQTDGFGIQNLHDRLGAIGGSITFESRTGRGTVVMGTIPVSGMNAGPASPTDRRDARRST